MVWITGEQGELGSPERDMSSPESLSWDIQGELERIVHFKLYFIFPTLRFLKWKRVNMSWLCAFMCYLMFVISKHLSQLINTIPYIPVVAVVTP